jgi:hypothetical protein
MKGDSMRKKRSAQQASERSPVSEALGGDKGWRPFLR